MCTVTIVPYQDGFRLVCNRDERCDRPSALPPALHRLDSASAVYPSDPQGGGTWVGLNDAGLAATLLNRTIGTAPAGDATGRRSRGLIIPRILGSRSLIDALDRAVGLDASQFRAFRLLLVQRMAAAVVTSDGSSLSLETMSLAHPIMLTSSSLGDARVELPRRRLFERAVLRRRTQWLQAQRVFHAHQWQSHTDVSVRMERADARTVSRTVINVTSGTFELHYTPLGSTRRAAV
jgi:uncharacterized protein with NRDE domain